VLRQYGSLEGALEAGRFAAQADELRMYRRIAAMDPDAPIRDVPDAEPDWAGGAALAREWGLNQLADRLEKRAS
jgi:hypothetical protein